MSKETNAEKNPKCPCPYKSCPRNGRCAECRAYHAKDGSSTGCGKRS